MKRIIITCYDNSESIIENNHVLFKTENLVTELIVKFPSKFIGYSKALDITLGGIKTQLLNLGVENSIKIELSNTYFIQGDITIQPWCSKVDEEYPNDLAKLKKQVFKEQTIFVDIPQYISSDIQKEFPDSIAQIIAMIGDLKTNTSSWYDGTGIPSPEIGREFDYYFNKENADIYKKMDSKWMKIANIRGVPGEQGIQGPPGERGERGETGSRGEPGASGIVMQDEEPTDPDTYVWVDSDENGEVFDLSDYRIEEPVVLYNNPNGTTENITLSDNVNNYEYIEMFFRTNDGLYNSLKVNQAHGKKVVLMGIFPNFGGTAYLKSKTVEIKDVNISNDVYSEISISSESVWLMDNDVILITKVLGYK